MHLFVAVCPLQEFQFRGIQKAEWQTLFDFISAKGLRIENLEETERGPGGGGRAINLDLGDDIDQGAALTRSLATQKSLQAQAFSQQPAGLRKVEGWDLLPSPRPVRQAQWWHPRSVLDSHDQ